MNMKKFAAIALAAAVATASSFSAYAVQELTETNQSGQTEVKAKIQGSVPAGVSYIIEIPDVIDFGTLTYPENNENSYVLQDFTITAREINGLTGSQMVAVSVKNENADTNVNTHFYITNKSNSSIKFTYDVFDSDAANIQAAPNTQAINAGQMPTAGYSLCNFTTSGEEFRGSIRINQNQLRNYSSVAEIVGDYNGHMVFSSMITD